MQLLIALLMAGGAAWWIVLNETRPAGANDLKVKVGDLRSYISEAERLIEQANAGKLTESFFRVEIEMLRDKSQAVVDEINAEKPQQGLEENFTAARKLAQSGVEVLDRIQHLFKQPEHLKSEKAILEGVFQQAVAMEKSLLQKTE